MSRAPFFINPMMRKLFRDWLRTCFGVGFASGQSLFDACLTAAEGKCFVDSSEPDQILRGAENSGWVHRAQNSVGGFTLEPKLIQRFAGLGGLSWSSAIAVKGGYAHHCHLYGWQPNRGNADALAFVGAG